MKTKKTITYHATGHCYGGLWGGGNGAYQARKFSANTKEALDKKINDAISDGSIDSGMGFESMLGAIMHVETKTIIEVEGKEFKNSEYELEFYGNLQESAKDFLEEVLINS